MKEKPFKKSICFVIHTLSGGGAEKVLIDTVNHLPQDKYDITVLSIVDTGKYRWDLKDHIHYKSIFKNPFRSRDKEISKTSSGHLLSKKNALKKIIITFYLLFWKYGPIKTLNNIFINDRYDITVSFLEGISSKLVSHTKGKKYSWFHVDVLKERKSEKVFRGIDDEISTYNSYDKIICVSNLVKDSVITKYNLLNDKVKVLYNILDYSIIREKSDAFHLEREDKFLMVSIGRLSSQKGFDRLINVAHKLKKDNIDFKINIFGEGSKKEELLETIRALALSDVVELKGFKANVYPYLKQSDLFICSSRAEGYSTVITESLVLGVPVISTHCAGVEEQLTGGCGLISDNDEESLYQLVKGVLSNKELYCELKRKATIKKNSFDIKEAITKLEVELDD